MLSTIDQHISALLFHHEIVVIPDFGAFITRSYPAELHTATDMLRPPSKRVAFNQRIKDNDGVLARYISKCENVSYKEALESIAISVRSWERVLRSGKRVHLNGIGKLFMEEAGRLQFSPGLEVNYEIKAYGLSIFRSQALQRSISVQQKVREAAQEVQAPAASAQGKKSAVADGHRKRRSSVKPLLKWAAVLIPIAALSFVGFFYQDEIEDKMSNISTLSPFPILKSWGAKSGDSKPSPASKTNEDSSRIIDYGSAAAETNRSETASKKQEKKLKPAPKDVNEAPKKPNSTSINRIEKTKSSIGHHIVVGSFSSSGNARNFAQSLTQSGYRVAVKKHGSKNMYRVIIIRQGEKFQALAQIKESVNDKAWIL